jgi:MYXO-CTERM domain-containing protein
MDIYICSIIGLILGVLAALIAGDWLVPSIALGVLGAVIGGWTFEVLGWQTPVPGPGGEVVVATFGAVGLLVFVRLLVRSRRRSRLAR